MSTEIPIRIGGGMVSWDLAPSNRQKLLEGLTRIGLENFMPPQKDGQACLGHALRHSGVFKPSDKKNKILVRPLEDNDGYTVKEEIAGCDDNDYPQLASAKLVGGEGALYIRVTPSPNNGEMETIRDSYREAEATASAASLGSALVKIVESGYGIPYTPAGHVYFIPEEKLARWEEIVRVVESSPTEGNTSQVFCIHAEADENLVKAITHYLTKEIQAEVTVMEEEIGSDTLGAVACNNRADKAAKLLHKVKVHADTLQCSFDSLNEQLNKIQSAAALAAIKAAAKAIAESAAA